MLISVQTTPRRGRNPESMAASVLKRKLNENPQSLKSFRFSNEYLFFIPQTHFLTMKYREHKGNCEGSSKCVLIGSFSIYLNKYIRQDLMILSTARRGGTERNNYFNVLVIQPQCKRIYDFISVYATISEGVKASRLRV